ncbi:MAG TPA: hypothetical protein VGJ00_05045 [Rhabdochlamydiaceae bacterium]|jgi:hypothetical protein
MLKDEFEKLMALFREGAEGKPTDLNKVFEESMQFFAHLKKEFEEGTPEERQEVVKMMTSMHSRVMDESKRILKNSGMSEEQLMTFSENPSNYTPEQWKEFQDSKSEIHKAGMDLMKVVKKLFPVPEHKDHAVQEIKEKGPKKIKSTGKKTGWMRT